MQNNIIIDNHKKKRKIKILILGDSHIHIFSTINNPLLDIRICKRQSATAYSLMKPESKSNSYNFFRKFLRNEETPNMNHPEEIFFADMGIQPNYIGIMLGEVDYRSLVFKKDPSNYKNTLSKKPYCKTIQRQLYSEHSDYYMSIQILLSLYKNIKFIGVGGAANIFSVIPTKSYFLLSKETYFNDSVKYKKEFEKNYFDNYFNFVFTPSVRYINAKYDVTQRSRQHISNIENFFRHRK